MSTPDQCARLEVSTPSSRATIAAYDVIAPEYDLPEHVTTRSLEEASSAVLRHADALLAAGGGGKVLELGCGTGAQTRLLAELVHPALLIATDPAARMLAVARERAMAGVVWERATATIAVSRHHDAQLVVGTLADPYLNISLVSLLARRLADQATILFTVPSRRWAMRERAYRLRVPAARTRFRLRDERDVEVDSLAYDVDGLKALFGSPAWTVVDIGYELGPPVAKQPQPEVAWIAVRTVSARRHAPAAGSC
ncbi:MAG: methyltransferase domain-containing protein [Sciscionella sp.]